MNDKDDAKRIASFDPSTSAYTTESGELERPVTRRRRIDCVGNPEIADRRDARRGGCDDMNLPAAS